MKKALLVIGIIVALIVGALLLWKVVFPFLGWVFSGIFGTLGFSFDGVADFFGSLLN